MYHFYLVVVEIIKCLNITVLTNVIYATMVEVYFAFVFSRLVAYS